MKVTSINLSTDGAETLSFSLRDLDPFARYQVKSHVGLDADEILSTFYGFGATQEDKHYEFSLPPREIVMRIALNPYVALGETASDIRDEIYRSISASRTGIVRLQFVADGATVAQIEGFMKKVEVPYFSKLPEIQITVKCRDPLIRGITPIKYTNLQLAAPAVNTMQIVDAQSTAPHGMFMRVTFNAPMLSFRLFSDVPEAPEWVFKVSPGTVGFGSGFEDGDQLVVNSNRFTKKLYLIRGGNEYPLFDKIVSGSVWPVVFPRVNLMQLENRDEITVNEVEFLPAYWGI